MNEDEILGRIRELKYLKVRQDEPDIIEKRLRMWRKELKNKDMQMTSIPKDAFKLSVDTIYEAITENWPMDIQDMINLAVVIDNIYHGFDNDGNAIEN